MTSLDHPPPAHVEAAPATHELAAVDAARHPVAETAVRAQRPCATVRLTEVGRVAQVDEVGVGRRLELFVLRHQLASCPADELLFNLRASTNTRRNSLPFQVLHRDLKRISNHRLLKITDRECASDRIF